MLATIADKAKDRKCASYQVQILISSKTKFMADFPGGVYSPRTKENKAGVVYDPDKKTT
ncbi:unnamed protein product, partial [marine sediment metagenome]